MSNVYELKGFKSVSRWGDNRREEVWSEELDYGFVACDLNECPEDATLDRDLFNSIDLLRAIKFGIELAKLGYDDVVIDWLEDEEEDEE